MTRGDDERTRMTVVPASPDDQATAAHPDVGMVAELRAAFGAGEKRSLPLYSLPDLIVVGRGTASDWQLDDPSLSRKHCQFRWNGRELTVEDLGSANGTRVGGRLARTATPVGPDDVVQLGTVMISFVPLVAPAPRRDIDAEATRLVAAPAGGPGETTPLSPVATTVRAPAELPPQKTVVKTPAQPGPPNTRAAVFHPEENAAGPEEPTREWDPNAALYHPPERAFDAAELLARLKTAWRTNRRPFVLAGAAVWVAILISLVSWKQARTDEDDAPPLPPPMARPIPKPVVTQLSPTGGPLTPAADVVEPSADPAQDLADAIAAYDNGRPQEALKYFRRLATDPNDKAARFMVQLIEARAAAAGKDKGAAP